MIGMVQIEAGWFLAGCVCLLFGYWFLAGMSVLFFGSSLGLLPVYSLVFKCSNSGCRYLLLLLCRFLTPCRTSPLGTLPTELLTKLQHHCCLIPIASTPMSYEITPPPKAVTCYSTPSSKPVHPSIDCWLIHFDS